MIIEKSIKFRYLKIILRSSCLLTVTRVPPAYIKMHQCYLNYNNDVNPDFLNVSWLGAFSVN